MQLQGALGQLANSNLRSWLRSCLRLYLGHLRPRPPSVDTLGHQAIQMSNVTRGRVGASVNVGLGVEKIDLTRWIGESGEYAMSKGAICRGLSFAWQMQILGSKRTDIQKPIRILKPIISTYILYTQICLDAPNTRSCPRNNERSGDAKGLE